MLLPKIGPSMANILALVLFIMHVSQLSTAKYIGGRAYLTPQKVTELSKFNFGTGKGIINATIEYQATVKPKGEVYLLMDTQWHTRFHTNEACDKVKHASARIPIGAVGAKIGRGLGTARGFDAVKSDKGRKKWHFTWEITHRMRTYGWYVVVADCDTPIPEAVLNKKGKKKKNRRSTRERIYYEMELMNEGGDHLSADERWLTEMYILATAILTGMWFYFAKLQKKTFGNGPKHLVITAIQIAYGLQIVSMMFEIFHQIPYRYNGYGLWLLDFFSEVIEGLSQTILSFVLLCLGNGWTFTKKVAKNKYDPSISEALNDPKLLDIDNPVLLILILFMFLSIMLQLVNKLYDDSFMKFHDHETYAGLALLGLRFIFGVLFFITLMQTIESEKKRGAGDNFVRFMQRLMVFGSVWFLAFPLIVFIASFFAHYLRHFVVTSGVLFTQTVCLCLLSYEFSSDKSMFAKFSEVQQAGMLPGFSRNTNTNYNKFV